MCGRMSVEDRIGGESEGEGEDRCCVSGTSKGGGDDRLWIQW